MSNSNLTSSGHTLATGSILHDNYIIDYVLGEGGFGITYSGTCSSTNTQVAIKEYFPSGVATRVHNDSKTHVSHYEGKLADSFQKGMRRFLNEANLLKEFQSLGSIVSVFDVFEENGTAYIVMEYIEGITLKQLILSEGALPFDEMLSLFKPVLLDLHEVHKKGLIHRDISPDNLIVGMDNRLHLIDFGAASFKNPNESKTMTVILKSGYAPPEQYVSDGKIGAWTDVYALCATMYMVLNGEKPIDAIRRMQHDTLAFSDGCSALEAYQKNAILRGLRLNYAERFSSSKLLYQALTTAPTEDITETVESVAVSAKMKAQIKEIGKPKAKRSRLKVLVAIGLFCVFLYSGLGMFGVGVPFWPEAPTIMGVDNPADTENAKDTEGEQPATATEDITTETPTTEASTEEPALVILTMINVAGQTTEDAELALKKLDSSITVSVTEEYNATVGAGLVISQSIAEDTQFTKGQITQIQLVVSKGPEPTTQAPRSTSSGGSNANTSSSSNNSDTKKKDDGYTTIHLD